MDSIISVRSGLAETQGRLIQVAVPAAQVKTVARDTLVHKLLAACRHGARIGAVVIGLGPFSGQAEHVRRHLPPEITLVTGDNYRAGLMLQVLERISDQVNIDLGKAEVLLIGADSRLGALCVRLLARQLNYLTILGSGLEPLAGDILADSGLAVRIAHDMEPAAGIADIVIVADEPELSIPRSAVRPTAIVWDMTAAAGRRKLQWVDAAPAVQQITDLVLELPGGAPLTAEIGLDVCCLAETILWALERGVGGRYVPGGLTVAASETVMRLAKKHGLRLLDAVLGSG